MAGVETDSVPTQQGIVVSSALIEGEKPAEQREDIVGQDPSIARFTISCIARQFGRIIFCGSWTLKQWQSMPWCVTTGRGIACTTFCT